MSNSKRWSDGAEATDDLLPADLFPAGGDAAKNGAGGAADETRTGKNGVRDAAQELAQSYWGSPEPFPLEMKSAGPSPSLWTMDLDSADGNDNPAPGGDIPPIMAGAPSFAPIPLRSDDPAGDAAPVLQQAAGAAELENLVLDLEPLEIQGAPPGTLPADEGLRPTAAHPAETAAQTVFDPFFGLPGGVDFLGGIPGGENPLSSRTRAGSSPDGRPSAGDGAASPAATFASSIWGTPSPAGAGGRPVSSRPENGAPESLAEAEEDGSILPFPARHEGPADSGAEILPWPGRPAPGAASLDAPAPVMASTPPGDLPRDGEALQVSPFDTGVISSDLLADAVHAALRNVYGEDSGDELAQEQSAWLAERELLQRGEPLHADAEAAPQVAASQTYGADAESGGQNTDRVLGESAEDWFGGRLDHQPTSFVEEPTTEAATEAVLHYLYGRRDESGRTGDPREDAAYPRRSETSESPLRAPAGRQGGPFAPQGPLREDPPLVRRAEDSLLFVDPAFRPAAAGRLETQPARGQGIEDRGAVLSAEQNREQRNMPVPTRPAGRLQAVPQDQMGRAAELAAAGQAGAAATGAGEKDSGRLLAAAGLSLIGGIALAGIVAVFGFNVFHTGGGENGGDPALVTADSSGGAIPGADGDAPPALTAAASAGPEERALTRDGTATPSPESEFAAPAADGPVAALPAAAPRSVARPVGPIFVSDISGASPGAIPIPLSLAPSTPPEAALLSIKGLPDQAKLSGGIDVGGGRWLLPPQKIEGLALSVPSGVSGEFRLEAQLMASDVRTAVSEPVSFTVSIRGPGQNEAPAWSAAPAALHSPTTAGATEARSGPVPDGGEIRDLLQDGNRLMREGDILAARRYYEKVAATGSSEGALAMGRSYDPSYYENLPVKTGKPDPALAFEWYKKALDSGLEAARMKIDNLKQWLLR